MSTKPHLDMLDLQEAVDQFRSKVDDMHAAYEHLCAVLNRINEIEPIGCKIALLGLIKSGRKVRHPNAHYTAREAFATNLQAACERMGMNHE